jgi:hypothetical protein
MALTWDSCITRPPLPASYLHQAHNRETRMLPPTRLAVLAAAVAAAACGGARATPVAAPAAVSPSPIDTTGLIRVRFARGTTSGLVNDSLRAGETRGYLLGADQGQVMMVHAITWPVRQDGSPPPAATVRVYSVADGRELAAPAGAGALWSGRLPSSGDYAVRVSATAPAAYTLVAQIPRRLTPDAGDPTAAITGTAPSRAPVDYIIAGRSGQTLAASVREGDPVTLHVYGLDGGEQVAPLPERRRLWAGRLPATQDYVVSVVPADEGARYELTVTLR